MNHGTATAPTLEQHSDQPMTHTNGLSKLNKVSPFLIVFISMTTAGLGSYFAARQDTVVVEARLDLEIQQSKAEIAELKVLMNQVLKDVVPRSEHDAVAEKEKTVERLREELLDEREQHLEHEIEELRKK